MPNLPVPFIILGILSAAVYLGFTQRVLDRMRLTDREALILVLAMLLGGFIPDIPLTAELSINVGGGLVPLFVVGYLFVRAGTNFERIRAILATLVTTGTIYALSKLLPTGPEQISVIEPAYLFAAIAGVVAYLAGRSRRSAFIGGVMGVVLADIIYAFEINLRAVPGTTSIGGAGVYDAVVLAGVIAVAVAEIVGETLEKVQGGPEPIRPDRPKELRSDRLKSTLTGGGTVSAREEEGDDEES